MKKIFTIFLLFFSLMIDAQTTYYIDPAGNNGNSGSIDSPWLTLTYACAQATTSGDIIHVNAGTYIETTRCVVAVGVSIVGDGVTSYIKSHYVSTSEYDGAIYLASSSGASTDGNQSISYIKLDGDGLTATRAIGVKYRNNVEIHHCTIINFNYSGVGLQGSTNSYPSATSTYHSTGNSVHDCIITNCSSMDVTTLGALKCSGQDGMLIYNNILDQTGRATDHNGDTFTSLWLKGVKIYNNVFWRNNEPNQWNFFSEIFFTEGGMEIYGNTFNGIANLDLVDIRKGSYAFGVKIYNNIFTAPAQGPRNAHDMFAIDLEERGAIQDVWIYNNYIKNHNTGIQFDIVANASDKTYVSGTTLRCERVYIYNNIIENPGNTTNNYARGVRIVPEGSLSLNPIVWDQIYIDNNTIVGGTANNMYAGVMVQTGGTMSNIYVRNNIIERANNNPVVFYYNLAGTQTNFNVNKNLYYLNVYNTIGYTNVTPTITGTDVTPADPLFVSSTDFHLTTGSPAIGTGILITTPPITTDFDGITVGNPPDIGAYEFISNHPPSIMDQSFQIAINSPNGTSVGTVVASDPDAGQTLQYSIVSGNTNDAFVINTSTGELSVAYSAALNVDFALVVKVQDNGIGELSSQATITINIIPAGIKFTEKNQVIKVYPNPVSDKLIIEIEGNKNNPGVEILNSMGQVVFEGNLAEKTIVQTSNFSPGIYLIKIENRGSFEFKKIIKV